MSAEGGATRLPASQRAALAAYSALLRVATPAYLARLAWRGRAEPLYRADLGERLGFGLPPMPAGAVWLHAVSLGEMRAAAPLVEALRSLRPGTRFVITTSTATGRSAAEALRGEGDAVAWFPFDTPGAVRRFLAHARPAAGVLIETEVWPNAQREAGRAGVPMLLASARLGERSFQRGRRIAVLLGPAFASLHSALAQTEADAGRLRLAGVRRVEVLGNLKFDGRPAPEAIAEGERWRRRLGGRAVVIAAVTREGEEAPLLAAWRDRVAAPRPLLLVVPRHPQRFDEVAGLVASSGFSWSRRSAWRDAPPAEAAGGDVWLGDSIGEMPRWYAMSDVALLGGSFAPLGGQNLIEAAACGCPLVMGPHTFHFADAAAQCIAAGAAMRVANLEEGVDRALALAGDAALPAWRERARAFAAAHRGAATRMAARVVEAIRASGGDRDSLAAGPTSMHPDPATHSIR